MAVGRNMFRDSRKNDSFYSAADGVVREIAESDCWLHHVCLSVRPYGTTGLPLERFFMTFDIRGFFLRKKKPVE